MFRSFFTRGAAALVALTAVSLSLPVTRADEITQSELPTVIFVAGTSIGTQGFADLGVPTVDSGNINTGTSFTIGNFISTASQGGYFAGLPTQIFGPLTFSTATGTSFSFGNGVFGSFASTSIVEQTNTPGERSFFILGNVTPGSFNPALFPNPAPASLRVSFTQTQAANGAISDSATLAIPPVPEPSTLMLACVGIAGGLAVEQNRRGNRRRRAAAAHDSETILG